MIRVVSSLTNAAGELPVVYAEKGSKRLRDLVKKLGKLGAYGKSKAFSTKLKEEEEGAYLLRNGTTP